MPKYKFHCGTCDIEVEKFVSPKVESIECTTCMTPMQRQFPGSGSHVTREVIDDFTNVRTVPDEKEQNKARKTEHFKEVEMPRLVQSGIYSTQTMLEEGWVVFNDKGEMVLNANYPSKS